MLLVTVLGGWLLVGAFCALVVGRSIRDADERECAGEAPGRTPAPAAVPEGRQDAALDPSAASPEATTAGIR